MAVATLVVAATPSAAHAGTAALSAPDWLLAYVGVAVVMIATAGARAALAGTADRSGPDFPRPDAQSPGQKEEAAAAVDAGAGRGTGHRLGAVRTCPGHRDLGPDTQAGNLAPVAVLSLWWVGLPAPRRDRRRRRAHGQPRRHVRCGASRAVADGSAAPWWTAPAAVGAVGGTCSPTTSQRTLARSRSRSILRHRDAGWRRVRWGRAWLVDGEAFAATRMRSPRSRVAAARPRPCASAAPRSCGPARRCSRRSWRRRSGSTSPERGPVGAARWSTRSACCGPAPWWPPCTCARRVPSPGVSGR